MHTLTLTRPDDWHLHLRDEDMLRAVLPHTAAQFARAIIMPNLRPPITTVAMAQAYRDRILAALPKQATFTPLMTLYLTDHTSPEEIYRAKASGFIHGVKLYPAGATTNSASGVTDIHKLKAVINALRETGLLLLIHGEVTDKTVDIFDREAVFIEQILKPLMDSYPDLKVVLEHITTQEAAEYVSHASSNLGATITPHHLLLNRNDMLVGGIKPHHYCLPIVKREVHRLALLAAATSGHPRFFSGTDSAPHAQHSKESACGCAGIYSAHAAVEFYAEAFDSVGALDKLEAFMSFHGADFYGLARNTDTITLKKDPWVIPSHYPFAQSLLIPFYAGQSLQWQMK
jgi:dihydroorotase